MRISTDPDSRHYRSDAHRIAVYLDGVKLNDCITADDEVGEAVVYERNRSGQFIYDRFDQLKRTVLTGVVRFEPDPRQGRVRA